jgi:hypothetical protein
MEQGFNNSSQLAAELNEQPTRVRNWMNGQSLPPVPSGIQLKDLLHITLDWLYHNDRSGLAVGKWVRIQAAMRGLQPPMVVDDDEPAVSTKARPVAKRSPPKRSRVKA